MDFSLYNTLSRRKEIFTPLHSGRVNFYSCGPTVYNVVHVGNLRAFVCADTLFRFLSYGLGYEVRWVMNITDVDDKTIRDSQKNHPGVPPLEALLRFTRHYEELFFHDLEQLNIPRKSFFRNPRATEFIPAMQDLIRRIHDHGCAYEKDGSIYFSLEKYTQKNTYGQLLPIDLKALETGRRTLADEIEKENVQDFVLWKGHKEGEPSWDFDFLGKNIPGRPGWHIECSAMEKEIFEELPFDIHSGGVDLEFPHHEDEIAQSIAGYGIAPTKYWIHNEHLMVDGQKMSKSLGNFYTLEDLSAKGHSAETLRFFFASNHYRTKLNLTEEALEAAATGVQRIRNALRGAANLAPGVHFEKSSDEHKEFLQALSDDLNTPKALAVLFKNLSDPNPDLFRLAEQIFGIRFFPEPSDIPVEIVELAAARSKAKLEKDYAEADRLRQEILAKGYEIRDKNEGYEILSQKL